MLSLQFIRDNRETVEKAIADKNVRLDVAALLAELENLPEPEPSHG